MIPLVALPLFLAALSQAAATHDRAGELGRAAARALRAAPGLAFTFERRTIAADDKVSDTFRARGAVSIGDASQPLFATLDGEPDAVGVALALRTDGDTVHVLDPSTKTLWTSRLYRAGLLLMHARGAGAIGVLTSPDTFENYALYAPRVVGREDVGGVACDVLAAALPNGSEYRLYIGVDDALPRRVWEPKDGGRTESTWTALRVLDQRIERPAAPASPAGFSVREFTLGGPVPGTAGPMWSAKDLGGNTITLEGLRGQVVVLDFWATWCAPCVASMPGVQKLYDEFKARGLVVIGARWSDDGDPTSVLKRLGITYPIVDGSSMANAYGIHKSGIPAVFVIGRDGQVVDYLLGYQGANTEARLRAIVTAQCAPR
ncbi:MAG: TlpA disulfide reductase family protein [Planctomycetota bacterium]